MTLARCPCCRQPLPADLPPPASVVEHLPISGHQRAMLDALARRFGQVVRTDALAAEIWGDSAGGPLDARQQISVMAYQVRPRIRPYGLTLTGMYGVGGGYRLAWMDSAMRKLTSTRSSW